MQGMHQKKKKSLKGQGLHINAAAAAAGVDTSRADKFTSRQRVIIWG